MLTFLNFFNIRLLVIHFEENYDFPENDYRKYWELYRHKEDIEITRELYKTLREIARHYDVFPAEVAINWLSKDEISKLNLVSDNLELNLEWFDRVRPK